MRSVKILSLVLTVAALTGAAAAETYEDLETGYRLPIPTGWKSKYDVAASALVLAGPGGIKVRLIAKVSAQPLNADKVVASYKKDGEGLKAKYGAVKVTAKPGPAGTIGVVAAQGYGFLTQKSGGETPETQATRAWLASGASEAAGKGLNVKFLAWGERDAMQKGEAAVAALLAGFGWPSAPSEEMPEEPRLAPDVLAAVDLPPPPKDLRSAEEVLVAAAEKVPAKWLKAAAAHLSGNQAFDRGSLEGGVGFMAEAGVCKDPEAAKAIAAAFALEDRTGMRSEEEANRAAAYLGFGSKPEAPDLPIPASMVTGEASEAE